MLDTQVLPPAKSSLDGWPNPGTIHLDLLDVMLDLDPGALVWSSGQDSVSGDRRNP